MRTLLPTKTDTFLTGNDDDVSQDEPDDNNDDVSNDNPDDNDVDCTGN